MKFVRAVDLASSLLIALVGTNRFGKFQKMTACRQKTPEGTKLTLPLAHLLPHTHTNKSPVLRTVSTTVCSQFCTTIQYSKFDGHRTPREYSFSFTCPSVLTAKLIRSQPVMGDRGLQQLSFAFDCSSRLSPRCFRG